MRCGVVLSSSRVFFPGKNAFVTRFLSAHLFATFTICVVMCTDLVLCCLCEGEIDRSCCGYFVLVMLMLCCTGYFGISVPQE